MQIEPELLALITGVLGALFALLWKWLETRYTLPKLSDFLDEIMAIVIATRENHDLKTDKERLDWAMGKVEPYLKAKGLDKYFNARVVVEYAIEIIKQREEARIADLNF
jgi:hypothetical protein